MISRGIGVGLCAAALAGCTLERAAPDEPAERAGQTLRPARPAIRRAGARVAPAALTTTVRALADRYEIEIQRPEGFSPRALSTALCVGARVFERSRESSSIGEYGAVFSLSRSEFAALPDGSALELGFGPACAGAQRLGALNKAALSVR